MFTQRARVHIVRADGSGERQIGITQDRPQWAPDGRSLLVAHQGIRVLSVNGQLQPALVQGEAPAWSPDGTRIAFLRTQLGPPEVHGGVTQRSPKRSVLYTIRRDGSGLREVARTSISEDGTDVWFGAPVWLPDGKSIVIPELGPDPFRLRRIDTDGGDESTVDCYCSEWSIHPEGDRVALGAEDGIEIISLGDGTRTTLTLPKDVIEGGGIYLVKWSPQGTKIGYIATRLAPNYTSNTELHVVDADGSNDRRVSKPGEDSIWAFDWRPRPAEG